MPHDEDLLSGLTDQEKEALKELDEQHANASDDDPEVTKDDLQQQQHKPLPADEALVEEEEEEDDEDAQAAAAAAAQQQQEQEEQDQPAPAAQSAPLLVAEAPADAEEKLQKIADDKAALVEKFDDGELTAKEYQQQLDALNKQERAIERQVDKAEIAADMERQRQVNENEATINAFLAEHNIKRDPTDLRFVTLDGAVRIVANQEENANLSPREILQKAHDLCVEQGTLPGKKGADGGKQQEQEPEKKPKPQIKAPKTLAGLPASEISDTDDARFAHINRIKDPDEREQAFMKLSPADQDAYLSRGA